VRQTPSPDFGLCQPRIQFLHRRRKVFALVGQPGSRDGKIKQRQSLHPKRAGKAAGSDARRRRQPRNRRRQADQHEGCQPGIAWGGSRQYLSRGALFLRRVEACHQQRKQAVTDARFAVVAGLRQRGDIERATESR